MQQLAAWVFIILLVWSYILRFAHNRPTWRRVVVALNGLLCVLAVYGILLHTVLGRAPSERHDFLVYMYLPGETFREMFMNALLYFPLGLTLTALVDFWSVVAGFVMSLSVESWQYFAGTGTAQVTDVLCNSLGCAVGVLPYLVSRFFVADDKL